MAFRQLRLCAIVPGADAHMEFPPSFEQAAIQESWELWAEGAVIATTVLFTAVIVCDGPSGGTEGHKTHINWASARKSLRLLQPAEQRQTSTPSHIGYDEKGGSKGSE